jgi:hypothetical protein
MMSLEQYMSYFQVFGLDFFDLIFLKFPLFLHSVGPDNFQCVMSLLLLFSVFR